MADHAETASQDRPNVIVIMTDNQQAATLGCYGNREIHSPNIDALAENGLRFDNAFCANSFCSPCRASALTGKMPSQHGVHSWIDDRHMEEWPEGWHALSGMTTLPEEMGKLGYRTGLFGKYHLGESATAGPGWERWVTMTHGHVRSFYKNEITDDGAVYEQPGHAVDFFTDKALEWIGADDQPYFAFIPFPAPYGHWPATNDGMRNRFSERYDDCAMETVPRLGLSPQAVASYDRVKAQSGGGLDFSMLMRAPNHLPSLRNYYSQISMIDEIVGRIAEAAPDALILFTADHGLSLGHHGFWGHGASTYPSNLHLAAHSVPLIARAPVGAPDGVVRADSQIYVSNMDIYATVLDYAGGEPDPGLPSRSFAGLLRGGDVGDWGADEVFAEQEETRVMRTPRWAYFKRFRGEGAPEFTDELFDTIADPGETNNLAADPAYVDVVADLSDRLDAFFALHADEKADLWRGGRPIQNSMLTEYWKGVWGQDWAPVYSYGASGGPGG